MLSIVIGAALIGLIPAYIAQSKGKSFVSWWIYGALLFIVALPHSLIMKADQREIENKQFSEGMKKCPYCAEMIKQDAKVCRYCHKDFPQSETSETIKCPKCNYIMNMDEKICPSCVAYWNVEKRQLS